MSLTTDDLAALRAYLPDTTVYTDQALNDAYDRLGAWQAVAAEYLRARLAALLEGPAAFTIPGDYSENNAANIAALERMIDGLGQGAGGSTGSVTDGVGRLVRFDRLCR